MNLQLSEIGVSEKELFFNLYNLYLYELSSYTGEDVREDGKFDLGNTHLYLEKQALIPYLIRADEQIAGFVLICSPPYTPNEEEYSIQELFLLKKFRGRNLAAETVSQVFHLHPGTYHVEQLENNFAAVRFWKKLYANLKISFVEERTSVTIDGLPGEHGIVSQRFAVTGA
ncbi:putative acetyltransferase [Fontibacillus phaseoli]|uniref:Putative acetyltransferase n=1 Tax=Fontibacillus phaseoli TaxID=1416533 RepID=A0A369BLD4_9BACL|nr:GNAT family N-acetyltransferase [Fontibacillus phaseoli]RCX21428.1 putative acetyltransferase [Fontibacillus phaseoli]